MSTYKYDIDRHVNPAWQSTDELLEELFVKPDKALESALSSHKSEHLPAINVSPLQGTLLFQLAMMQSGNASRPIHILEVGTLAGCEPCSAAARCPPCSRAAAASWRAWTMV